MKRSPMPPASKPMQRGAPLARTPFPARTSGLGWGGGLSRSSMPRATPCQEKAPAKAKRQPVSAEEKRARATVRARSGGVCEGCNQARATNWSHRVARSQSGAWTASNGMDLCGSGTTGCHGWVTAHPVLARARGWALRSTDNPAELPALHAVHGWVLLDVDGGLVPVDEADARQALAA